MSNLLFNACFVAFVKNMVDIPLSAYLWVLCSIPLPYLFALMLELSCFLITVALFYNLKSTIMIPPDVFLLLGITLAICDLS